MKVWVYQIYDDIDSIYATQEGLIARLRADTWVRDNFEAFYAMILKQPKHSGWNSHWRSLAIEEAWEDYLQHQGQEYEVLQ